MIKKFVLIISLILVTLIMFTGCIGPGLSDWTLKLPNNYEMWHINSSNIAIGYKNTDSSLTYTNSKGEVIGIQAHVIEFCHNGRFVGAKQVDVEQDFKKEIDESNPRFYLLDTNEQKIYGPFETEVQFNNKCKELQIPKLSKWEKTNPAPENAVFPIPQ